MREKHPLWKLFVKTERVIEIKQLEVSKYGKK